MSEHVRSLGAPRHAAEPAHYELIAIAASAGGLQAIRRILAALPADFPTPIAVVLHRSDTNPSLLAKILQRSCRLTVKDAAAGAPLEAGTVYVAPPDLHLAVGTDHRLELLDGRRVNFLRSSAEPLFRSAAHAFTGRVIAVVLTGGGRNGAESVRDVKALGGTVIAQDEATSQVWGMPRAAIATGAVDYVLPLDGIAPMLTWLTTSDVEGGESRRSSG